MTPGSRLNLRPLREKYGQRLQENICMADYTTIRAGGTAPVLLPVHSADELAEVVELLWKNNLPYLILGGGSNILVSDAGIDKVVILNRAKNIRIDANHNPITATAESGANFNNLGRQTALRGLSGLEWAASIPGSVGGAVYGNAGAFGADTQAALILADILHHDSGRGQWPVERLQYQYRSSGLKQNPGKAVILSATFRLTQGSKEQVEALVETNVTKRRQSQPAGATMGSTFKNPPGDYAGRLIEAAGLKGKRIGGAEISDIHANFIVNTGGAAAADVWALIKTAREAVQNQFGVILDLEIELVGDFE